MRQFAVAATLSALTALSGLTTLARAQDPGASLTDFDKKRGRETLRA